MEAYDNETKQNQDEIYSNVVRAGKRTYFFDVKSTRSNDFYLTITESKRRFSNEENKFFYEKHKLFLYKEDFEKFTEGLADTIVKIQSLQAENGQTEATKEEEATPKEKVSSFSDVRFEDLGDEKVELAEETADHH